MKERGWELQYVSWEEYKEALVGGFGQMWNNFLEGDLVFGGMDFSCDFMYFSVYFIEIKLIPIFHRNPSMGYNLTAEETCLIFVNLKHLAEKTMIWPHSEELFWGGSKIQCYDTLRVASHSMGISTPLHVIADIRDKAFVKEFSEGRVNGVLKRDYSMKCEHVILHTDPDSASKIKNSLRKEENTWNPVKAMFGLPRWFIQPTVAQLLHVGEVRCFIVSGRLLSKITTTPGSAKLDTLLEVTDGEPLRPLHTHK